MHRWTPIVLALLTALLVACPGEEPADNDPDPTTDAGADVEDDGGDQDPDLALESVFPVEGTAAGGDDVSLYGTGFVEDTAVSFGDDAAQTTYISSTQIDAVTPGGSPGVVDLSIENPDGDSDVLADAFEYLDDAVQLEVGWCTLQYPDATTVTKNEETGEIFGRVFVEGCTDIDADCPSLAGELGWGDAAVDPSGEPEQWEWSQAAHNPDHDGDDNFEYEATITADEEGTFGFVYRFTADGGDSWTYCDLEGSDNGFDTAQMGELVVEPESQVDSVDIGWCNLQWPEEMTAAPSAETDTVFGRVYVEDCTGSDGECEEVVGEVGVGPESVDPSDDPGSFQWFEAEYNPGHSGDDNDEHMGTATAPADAGTYGYAVRFSGDEGEEWTYCDLDGTDDGFDPARMGELTVAP